MRRALFALTALAVASCGEVPERERVELDLSQLSADDVLPPEAEGGTEAEAPSATPAPTVEAPAALTREPAFGPVERVLAADLDGDGRQELLAGSANAIRWGTWDTGQAEPTWSGGYEATGVLQAWLAGDFDGDGREEVIAAFGMGRGFGEAPLSVVLVAWDSRSTVAIPIYRANGERNQVTSLVPWPREGAPPEIYLTAFEDRFTLRGGLLSIAGGPPKWLEGHRLRMGLARAVGDFDGDGKLEVAIGRLYGDGPDLPGDLRVVDDDGTVAMIPTLRGVRTLSSGDVDGDGRPELLFGDGWHKAYGKHARFRPSIARYTAAGGWSVTLVEERADQYAVEQIGLDGAQLVAGGNREVRRYERSEGTWVPTGTPQPTSIHGSWTILNGALVTAGATPRR